MQNTKMNNYFIVQFFPVWTMFDHFGCVTMNVQCLNMSVTALMINRKISKH